MNNHSLNFVKDRITSGLCNGMENNIYRNMYEVPFLNIANNLQSSIPWYDNVIKFKLCGNTDDSSGEMNVTVRYDPDAEFECFTMERCKCDGTYIFFEELYAMILNKVYGAQTYNIEKAPSDFCDHPFNYNIEYIVGDFVNAEEYGDEFSIEDKPWIKSRFSVMLPMKMNFESRRI